MRKILTAAAAALTLAGGLAATTAPVQAQTRGHGGSFHGGGGWRGGGGGWRGGGYRGGYYHGGGWGYGAAALGGLALGAALASPYNYGPGYGYGYYDYGPGYYDNGGCARQVWDPYYGRWTVRYYC
jgi:hypothetical protein